MPNIICPNHEGSFDCTPFCPLCEGNQEYTPTTDGELMETNPTPVEVIDPCTYCGESTAFGYGRFVNRLPVDDGWGCAECSGFNCDECDKQIYLDCEVRDAEGWNYHPSCLPLDQHVGYDPDDPDDEGCGCDLCDLEEQKTQEEN